MRISSGLTIERGMKLKKLMNVYCETKSVAFNHYAFLFDGRRLDCDQTPYELGLRDGDGDVIDAPPHKPRPLANLNAFRYSELSNGKFGYDLCREAPN